MRMAGVSIGSADNLLVRVEADNGLLGWGEAASAPTMTGDLQAGMVAAVREILAPALIGEDALEHARLGRSCAGLLAGNHGAKSAVEMALLDLAGRHLEVPVSDLLGGALRRRVRPMLLLGNERVDDDIAEARANSEQGVGFFKLKLGVKPLDEEIAATRALRAALGEATTICADANMGYTVEQAERYAAAVAECGLLFLEQPVRDADIEGMARVAASGAIPLCADEPIAGAEDIRRFHAAGAARGVNLKTIKFGGPSATVRAGHLCEALGLSVNLACKVAESSIGAAALAHVGAAIARLDWGVSVTHRYLADDLVIEPLEIRNGEVEVPTGPGLGVEIDERRIERYRVR